MILLVDFMTRVHRTETFGFQLRGKSRLISPEANCSFSRINMAHLSSCLTGEFLESPSMARMTMKAHLVILDRNVVGERELTRTFLHVQSCEKRNIAITAEEPRDV